MSYLKTYYDAKSRPLTSYPGQLTQYLKQQFNISSGMRLLEPGVGRGEHLKLFEKLGLKVEGFDISPHSKEFSPNLNIKVMDSAKVKWPYDNDRFDVVYSKSFVEHLSEPIDYFRQAYRVLKPGGLLLTLTPDWEAQYKTFYDDYTHIRPFTKISLKNIKLAEGFEDVNVFKLRQLPVVWKYPALNLICAAISPFIPVRTQKKIFRWSRELMLVGSAIKPNESRA